MSDDDDVAEATGLTRDLDVGVQLLDLDRAQHRMHYDVVANGVLWFVHHGMFDHTRRPRFDLHFRDTWDAFVAVNQRFTDAVVETAAEGDIVLVQDYQLTMTAGQLRAQRPDLRVVHFTHTPFAGPDDYSVLPTDIGEALCGALASGPAGFHTERWAEGYHQSARATLGKGAQIVAPFASSLGPDIAALEEVAASAARRGRGHARRRGRRPPRDRAQRPHRPVQEHRPRLPRVRPVARSPARTARARGVRRDGLPVAPGARGIPRVRERGRTGRRQGQRPLGDRRLAADPARRPRRLRPVGRGYAALRRAPRELDQGRAQPGRQGRPRTQPARRRVVPVTGDGFVGGVALGLDPCPSVRPRAVRGRTRRRAVDAARRTRGARRQAARSRRPAHRPTGSTTSSAPPASRGRRRRSAEGVGDAISRGRRRRGPTTRAGRAGRRQRRRPRRPTPAAPRSTSRRSEPRAAGGRR